MTITKILEEFEDKLIGENGWLIDNPHERCEDIKSFISTSITALLEDIEKEIRDKIFMLDNPNSSRKEPYEAGINHGLNHAKEIISKYKK